MNEKPRTHAPTGRVPTVSVGLPVYNGERYLARALDALLAQTYEDFEIIISDNASTDGTERICRDYAQRDSRIRYVRQPVNVGAAPNHNLLVGLARGRYFKWASHDDVYAPELLRLCVEALERYPDVVLAHAWDTFIDEQGKVIEPAPYTLDTANRRPEARLRSLLHVSGGNDVYGVMRIDVLRRLGGGADHFKAPHGSYYKADRVFVSAMALHGRFYQVPEILYFRREHPERMSRAGSWRREAAVLDPRRASRLRYPMVRMYLEYILGYVTAIRRAPLTTAERGRCLAEVGRWLASRVNPGPLRIPLRRQPSSA